jgi:hypothetical protein
MWMQNPLDACPQQNPAGRATKWVARIESYRKKACCSENIISEGQHASRGRARGFVTTEGNQN